MKCKESSSVEKKCRTYGTKYLPCFFEEEEGEVVFVVIPYR